MLRGKDSGERWDYSGVRPGGTSWGAIWASASSIVIVRIQVISACYAFSVRVLIPLGTRVNYGQRMENQDENTESIEAATFRVTNRCDCLGILDRESGA